MNNRFTLITNWVLVIGPIKRCYQIMFPEEPEVRDYGASRMHARQYKTEGFPITYRDYKLFTKIIIEDENEFNFREKMESDNSRGSFAPTFW